MRATGTRGWVSQLVFLLLTGVLLSGCATTPKIDWNSRVGNFTYDQAVLELGPPENVAQLTDGTKVAEWLRARGLAQGFAPTIGPYVSYPYFYGPPAVYYSQPPSPNRYLQLTFSPDGKLMTWKRVYR